MTVIFRAMFVFSTQPYTLLFCVKDYSYSHVGLTEMLDFSNRSTILHISRYIQNA